MYYNGTSERYWWNQDSDVVSVYVPVPEGFDQEKVEFVAKTRHVSLKFDGEEVSTAGPALRDSRTWPVFVRARAHATFSVVRPCYPCWFFLHIASPRRLEWDRQATRGG